MIEDGNRLVKMAILSTGRASTLVLKINLNLRKYHSFMYNVLCP